MTQSTAIKGQKVKFATQLSSDVLAELRQMAHEEGRQIQSILDEALREYIENKRNAKPRTHVMAALFSSMTEHDALYEALSKRAGIISQLPMSLGCMPYCSNATAELPASGIWARWSLPSIGLNAAITPILWKRLAP